MDYIQIAADVETKNFGDSAVHKYMGGNVKSPGLSKGSFYVIKYWSAKSLPQGSDNVYWIGEFLGAGSSADSILNETPRAKSMTADQRYYFRRPNGEIVAARNFDGALVVNDDDEQRITFYSLLNEPLQDALPLQGPPIIRPVKARDAEPLQTQREHTQRAVVRTQRAPKIQKDRESVSTEIPEHMYELFRPSPPPQYREFLVAQFGSEAEARRFAKEFTEGNYVQDGVAHTTRAPADLNDTAKFISQAKEAGARSVNRLNAIVLA